MAPVQNAAASDARPSTDPPVILLSTRVRKHSEARPPDLPGLLGLLSRVGCHVYSGEMLPDGDYRESFTGPGLAELLGRAIREEEDATAAYHGAVHPDDWEMYLNFGSQLGEDSTEQIEYRLVQPDGSLRWVLDRMWVRFRLPNGSMLVDGVVSDVTELKLRTEQARSALREVQLVNSQLEQARAEAAEATAWLEAAVTASPSALVLLDRELRARLWNPAAERLFGWTSEDALGNVAPHCSRDDLAQLRAAVERLLAGEPSVESERVLSGRIGHPRQVSLVSVPVRGGSEEITGYLEVVTDITVRKEMEARLRLLAHYDPLTGLANRVSLTAAIEEALATKGSIDSHLSVLLLDLDGFKSVNDSLGHAVGDELLCAVSQRLAGCLRPGDMAARLGGDEFAVLLRTNSKHEAVAIAERILKALQEPIALGRAQVVVTGSIGAVHAAKDQGAADLLRDADVAMYKAKLSGKNRVALFKGSMQRDVVERLNLEAQLRRAVEQRQFELHFQPLQELKSGRIVGAEALIRWRHPRRGLLLPSAFLSVAEETGLIVKLGRWILDEACAQAARWLDSYGSAAPYVAVNLSARQLQDPEFVFHVSGALARAGLEGRSLVVEITESLLVNDREAVAGRLAELRALGVGVALDDFGTGFSSLSYLSSFPVDALKIDQSFVRPLTDGPRQAALVRAIVELARALEVATVAEGVDRPEQARILSNLGCDIAQGFYLRPPDTAASLNNLLDEVHRRDVDGAGGSILVEPHILHR
jgi:diguanylate cyclase (GGDEF)-like protein/PAS domain S-box-containing protein